jgi:hypothetical protein
VTLYISSTVLETPPSPSGIHAQQT